MEHKVEDIFKLLKESKWIELLEIESKNRQYILNDNMIKQIFDSYFIDAVVTYIDNSHDKLYNSLILQKVYHRFLHRYDTEYSIHKDKFEELVVAYLKTLESLDNNTRAYKISKDWLHLEYAKQLSINYEKINSKELKHTSDDWIKVSENPNIQQVNHTISLFKSKQENEFFYAIREYYPNYFTYPNVAISCIIDFKKIKDNLSNQEKDYFFKAIIDSVVYEQTNDNFIPKLYFELDSIYHDTKEQILKDKMKDKFFSLAGQKLIRIRSKLDINLVRNDFKKLIKELIT
jgi:hypothetical protein